jgi:hypothetical protein
LSVCAVEFDFHFVLSAASGYWPVALYVTNLHDVAATSIVFRIYF